MKILTKEGLTNKWLENEYNWKGRDLNIYLIDRILYINYRILEADLDSIIVRAKDSAYQTKIYKSEIEAIYEGEEIC